MNSIKSISVRSLFAAQTVVAVAVAVCIHLFTPPIIARKFESVLANVKPNTERGVLHYIIFNRLKSYDVEFALVSESHGEIELVYDEIRLERGYRALIFYSRNGDQLGFLSSIVIGPRGETIETMANQER